MELEPPLVVAEDMPFAPRVSYDGLFEKLAGVLADSLGAGDGTLFSLREEISGNVADGLDGKFTSTIGAAETVYAGQGSPENDPTAGQLADTGQAVEARRQAAQPFLPDTETPIEGDFRDLPDFGAGHPGQGGIDGGDPDPGKD